jgi:hypothetical protein
MQLKNHEWTLMNTNLRTRTIIQPFAPQSLNGGREFRRKGTPILWFHWCLFVFTGGLTESLRLSVAVKMQLDPAFPLIPALTPQEGEHWISRCYSPC